MSDATAAESASLETRAEATAIGGEAQFWQGQLGLAESKVSRLHTVAVLHVHEHLKAAAVAA